MNERRGKQNSGAPRPSGAARSAPNSGRPGAGAVRPAQSGVPNAAPRNAKNGAGGTGVGKARPNTLPPNAGNAVKAGSPSAPSKKGAAPAGAAKNRPRPPASGQPIPGRPAGQAAAAKAPGSQRHPAPAGRAANGAGGKAAPRQMAANRQSGAAKAGKTGAMKKAPGKLSPETAAQRRRDIRARRGVTPEQAEFMRRRREIKKYYVKKRRISAITLFLTRFTLLVIIYVVFFAISSGLFALSLVVTWPEKGEDVVYQLGENKKDTMYKVETLEYGGRVRDGQIYLNFSDIADYLDFVTTGDLTQLRYLTKYTDGEEVVFDVGATSVTVNGNMTRMPAPSYYEGGALYVPLDFIKTYIRGISVGINEDNGRLVLYREYTLSTKNEKVYGDITFTLKQQKPTEHIDENGLPADIKLATEPSRRQQDEQS